MADGYSKAVLHKDYYNNVTADEIKGIYKLRKSMRKLERNEFLFHFISISIIFAICFSLTACLVKRDGPIALLYGSRKDSMGEIILLLIIGIVVCVIDFAVVFYRWKEFYIGVGEVVSAKCEHIVPDKSRYNYMKKYPEGYYKCILDIAVSDGLAINDVTYYSPVPINVGERAASVYFPRTHLLYAVCGDFASNENPKDFCYVIYHSRNLRN